MKLPFDVCTHIPIRRLFCQGKALSRFRGTWESTRESTRSSARPRCPQEREAQGRGLEGKPGTPPGAALSPGPQSRLKW